MGSGLMDGTCFLEGGHGVVTGAVDQEYVLERLYLVWEVLDFRVYVRPRNEQDLHGAVGYYVLPDLHQFGLVHGYVPGTQSVRGEGGYGPFRAVIGDNPNGIALFDPETRKPGAKPVHAIAYLAVRGPFQGSPSLCLDAEELVVRPAPDGGLKKFYQVVGLFEGEAGFHVSPPLVGCMNSACLDYPENPLL
jgi:hypothetical protein